LRTAIDLDPLDVPERRGAEDELIICDCSAVDDDGRPRPVSSQERGQGLQGPGRVEPADCRSLTAVAKLHVGDERKHLIDAVRAGGVDIASVEDGDARCRFSDRSSDSLAGNNDGCRFGAGDGERGWRGGDKQPDQQVRPLINDPARRS